MSEEDVSRFTAPIILIVEFLLALILAVYLLYNYGDFRRHNPFVTICTLIIWFMSFVIIFLLPVDVSSVSMHIGLELGTSHTICISHDKRWHSYCSSVLYELVAFVHSAVFHYKLDMWLSKLKSISLLN